MAPEKLRKLKKVVKVSCIESVLTTSMSKQRGFTSFSVFLKRVSLLYPQVRTKERASKFGLILPRDRGLVNNCSAAAGRVPNWTGRALNSSYFKEKHAIGLHFCRPKLPRKAFNSNTRAETEG